MATKKRPSASPHIILSGAKVILILFTAKLFYPKITSGGLLALRVSVFFDFYRLRLKSLGMESYLRIRNNLFLVSFWKRAPFGRLPAFQAG